MPALTDCLIAVTLAAGLAHRKRQNRLIVRRNFITFLATQPNNMNGDSQAPVTYVTNLFLAVIGNG
jgi:hypothetical protein